MNEGLKGDARERKKERMIEEWRGCPGTDSKVKVNNGEMK